jgi:hypothetical protein
MRAAFAHGHGPADSIEYGALLTPTVGTNDVLVRMEATAVNHVDLVVRSGAYQSHIHSRSSSVAIWWEVSKRWAPGSAASRSVTGCGATVGNRCRPVTNDRQQISTRRNWPRRPSGRDHRIGRARPQRKHTRPVVNQLMRGEHTNQPAQMASLIATPDDHHDPSVNRSQTLPTLTRLRLPTVHIQRTIRSVTIVVWGAERHTDPKERQLRKWL